MFINMGGTMKTKNLSMRLTLNKKTIVHLKSGGMSVLGGVEGSKICPEPEPTLTGLVCPCTTASDCPTSPDNCVTIIVGCTEAACTEIVC